VANHASVKIRDFRAIIHTILYSKGEHSECH